MNSRKVLHAASGLLLVLAAGLLITGFFVAVVVAPAKPSSPETLLCTGLRLALVLLFASASGMGVAGALASIFGKEAK